MARSFHVKGGENGHEKCRVFRETKVEMIETELHEAKVCLTEVLETAIFDTEISNIFETGNCF